MGLLRWLTQNTADTRGPSHPDLAPLELPLPPDRAVDAVWAAINLLPQRRWRVQRVDTDARTIHVTRHTRLARFVDDVRLSFETAGTGSRVNAESRSRLGKGDFGQNRRNILELWDGVTRGLATLGRLPDPTENPS